MRSSRNNERTETIKVESCNRLENAVKPQLLPATADEIADCNRLENAVKPQQSVNH